MSGNWGLKWWYLFFFFFSLPVDALVGLLAFGISIKPISFGIPWSKVGHHSSRFYKTAGSSPFPRLEFFSWNPIIKFFPTFLWTKRSQSPLLGSHLFLLDFKSLLLGLLTIVTLLVALQALLTHCAVFAWKATALESARPGSFFWTSQFLFEVNLPAHFHADPTKEQLRCDLPSSVPDSPIYPVQRPRASPPKAVNQIRHSLRAWRRRTTFYCRTAPH